MLTEQLQQLLLQGSNLKAEQVLAPQSAIFSKEEGEGQLVLLLPPPELLPPDLQVQPILEPSSYTVALEQS